MVAPGTLYCLAKDSQSWIRLGRGVVVARMVEMATINEMMVAAFLVVKCL